MKRREPGQGQDVGDVMREETHRGKKRGVVDTQARRLKARRKAALAQLLRDPETTEADLLEALSAVLEREPDTPEVQAALRRCRAYLRGRGL
jgi:hypothetical protein